ncbi:MAG: CPBP family intramembrane metalloprotease [Alphaproteobacteria bacterium]|nr:CPBP family intramembrane metalloprotease [Alphaproteobacteria bacterium]
MKLLHLKQLCFLPLLLGVCFYAFCEGFIRAKGLAALLAFALVAYAHLRIIPKNKIYNFITALAFVGLIWLLITHAMPGFANPIIFDHVQVSQMSSYYSMRINFDKVIPALIIFTFWIHSNFKWSLLSYQIKVTAAVSTACIACILFPAVLSGFVKFDPKIPNITTVWALNNLFCVCFSEEVIFRLYVQSKVEQFVRNPFASILIASAIFGYYHYYMHSGMIMAILAAVCGIFYGYAFSKTNRSVICAILVHFSLNLCHFLLFTYPHVMRN